jgi:hypothetical protein
VSSKAVQTDSPGAPEKLDVLEYRAERIKLLIYIDVDNSVNNSLSQYTMSSNYTSLLSSPWVSVAKALRIAGARPAARLLSVLAVTVLSLGPLRASTAHASEDRLEFGAPVEFDGGTQGSVALHSSNLVLEVHKSNSGSSISYRVGSLGASGVSWGPGLETGLSGSWPTGALSKEGYFILVYSNSAVRSGAELFYRVGKIDPDGGTHQSISWLTDGIHWDGGFHTSIAINDNGVIVGVHESNNTGNNNLHYRIGQLRNPAAGDYTIHWNSGHLGIRYDAGINPHIAINNNNQVVVVHEVPPIAGVESGLLHYRRGTVNFSAEGNATIDFGGSQRYDSDAAHPAVALLDNGKVLEVQVRPTYRELYSRVGWLSPSDAAIVHWSPSTSVTRDEAALQYPALAANGTYAVETHHKRYPSTTALYYSIAGVTDTGL